MVMLPPTADYRRHEMPEAAATRSRRLPTRPPRILTISAVLVLVAVAAGIGYHLHQPAPAVDLQYPGSVQLLSTNDPQELQAKGALVGPREDRIYGIPAALGNKVSYQEIVAWYHERFLALGWTFQSAYPAYPLSQYLAGETWSQGCEYLSVRIWVPETAEPDFNDPKVYPITFELWQQNYCPS